MAAKKKAKKNKKKDDSDDESGEDEIWKALVKSRPEVETTPILSLRLRV